jgi:hypothetical protein
MPALIVIVDPNYGDGLERAAQSAPVWIVDTKRNKDASKRLWNISPRADHREKGAVTTYEAINPEDRLSSLLGIVPQLESHHGKLVANELTFPDGFVLGVIGLQMDTEVTTALREHGFRSFIKTSEGFEACK